MSNSHNSKFKTQNSKSIMRKAQNSKLKTQNSKFKTQNSKFIMRKAHNSKFKTQNSKFYHFTFWMNQK